LGKSGHGGDGAETGKETVESVGEDTALDSTLVNWTLDFDSDFMSAAGSLGDIVPGDIACGSDITNGFHHQDQKHGKEW
jgi:hypothetical protein